MFHVKKNIEAPITTNIRRLDSIVTSDIVTSCNALKRKIIVAPQRRDDNIRRKILPENIDK